MAPPLFEPIFKQYPHMRYNGPLTRMDLENRNVWDYMEMRKKLIPEFARWDPKKIPVEVLQHAKEEHKRVLGNNYSRTAFWVGSFLGLRVAHAAAISLTMAATAVEATAAWAVEGLRRSLWQTVDRSRGRAAAQLHITQERIKRLHRQLQDPKLIKRFLAKDVKDIKNLPLVIQKKFRQIQRDIGRIASFDELRDNFLYGLENEADRYKDDELSKLFIRMWDTARGRQTADTQYAWAAQAELLSPVAKRTPVAQTTDAISSVSEFASRYNNSKHPEDRWVNRDSKACYLCEPLNGMPRRIWELQFPSGPWGTGAEAVHPRKWWPCVCTIQYVQGNSLPFDAWSYVADKENRMVDVSTGNLYDITPP